MTEQAMPGIAVGALVRWTGGDIDKWGSLRPRWPARHCAFRRRRDLQFAWPADNLIRIVLDQGQTVRLKATDERSVVTDMVVKSDHVIYVVSLTDGSSKTVTEAGVRPPIGADPIARLRTGEIDTARSSTSGRGYPDPLRPPVRQPSSLSNSRVEIKPHQVAVLHRVASTFPHRFILADEVGLGKTIEAGLILKELRARGFAERVLIWHPPGSSSSGEPVGDEVQRALCRLPQRNDRFLAAENPGENVWGLPTTSSRHRASPSPAKTPQEIALAGSDIGSSIRPPRSSHVARRVRVHREPVRLAEMLADPDMGSALAYLL